MHAEYINMQGILQPRLQALLWIDRLTHHLVNSTELYQPVLHVHLRVGQKKKNKG